MMKTVFFNLDNTFFDHQHSRGCGFADLKAMHHMLSPEDIRDAPAWARPLSQRKSPRTVRRCDTAYFRRCELLERLQEEGQVGTITNCLCELQNEKNTIGGIVPLIEYQGFSQNAGFRTPDRHIFEKALALAGSESAEAVCIGIPAFNLHYMG